MKKEVQVTMRVIIDAPKKLVWEVITNNEQFAWRSDLDRIDIKSATEFIEYTKQGFSTYFTITEKIPFETYAFSLENTNMKGSWIGTLKEFGNQTELECTERIMVKRAFLRLLVKPYLRKQQKQYQADLKEALGKLI